MKNACIALAILGALSFSPAFAEPVRIQSSAQLDSQVIDSAGPVLFVMCNSEAQCSETETLLRQSELDSRVIELSRDSQKLGKAPVKLTFAAAANLPELSSGWDAGDREICLRDVSKNESQCNNLAYPVFIVQKKGRSSSGSSVSVEEMSRGPATVDQIVGMISYAQSEFGSKQKNQK